jgi:DNA-binding transcriptional LysR family regulator
MDRLARIQVFARVADRGGFSAAGRDLGLSQAAVSKAVSALERELGARLVQRSTRAVALTEAGETYLVHCRAILAELDAGAAAVGTAQAGVAGSLRVAAPVPFGLAFVSPRTARFQAQHPGLSLSLDLDDHALDLVEAGIDVAIRLGHLGSEAVAARRLGDSPFLTVAAPEYLARRGEPASPAALTDHDCLGYALAPGPLRWDFACPDAPAVTLVPRYRANNLLAVKDAALAGLGIARLPQWMVAAEVEVGALRSILADYPPPSFGIHAVFPSPRRIAAKARLFADFMQAELVALPGFKGPSGSGQAPGNGA